MSTYCEICEGIANAVSLAPATDVISLSLSTADSTSSAVVFTTPQEVLTGVAATTSSVVIEAYALMINAANSVSTISPTLVVTSLAMAGADANSTVTQFIDQLAVATANAEDEIIAADIPQLLISAAQAISSADVGSIATLTVGSAAEATDSVALGLLEVVTSPAVGSSSVVILRKVEVEATGSAAATSTVTPNAVPQFYLLLSVGDAASVVEIQQEVNMLFVSSAEATSSVWSTNKELKAWVMNTETAAVSWYDNFGFESIADVGTGQLGVGEDGIYALDGSTDAGTNIRAEVISGFVDFGTPQQKHLDNLYFGYTSQGQIAVQTEVLESAKPPATYLLEERPATAPRNSRVTPGKGLWGRYWRLSIKNVDGADFEVHDASVDIAVSSRRI